METGEKKEVGEILDVAEELIKCSKLNQLWHQLDTKRT